MRPYANLDANELSNIFRRAILEIGPRHYSAEQVSAWVERTPDGPAVDRRANDGRKTFVALDERDNPVGFIDLEADGHIDLFYCAPEVTGNGVSALLYDHLESVARSDGLTRLYSEASEAALRFFRKRGFTLLHRRDLSIGGVAIHNFAVEKRLD